MAKKNFESLNNIFETNKIAKTLSIKKYKSDYDYSNIIEEDREKLLNSEEEILIHKKEINKSYLKIAQDLYESNKILASYDKTNGKFIRWFELLGLKKTFVYNSIKRFELYLLIEDEEKVNKLSQKAVEMIGSKRIEDSDKIKLLKTEGIEEVENKSLKNQIKNIISDRSEMIGKDNEIKENTKKSDEKIEKNNEQFIAIKKLLIEVEKKTNGKINEIQLKKLKKIEKILKEI